MTRDTYDRFTPRDRGLFGENELARSASNETVKARLTDLTLVLRQDRATSIAVTQTGGVAEKWIFLPKSLIEYRALNATTVEVTLPESLAREKGLI